MSSSSSSSSSTVEIEEGSPTAASDLADLILNRLNKALQKNIGVEQSEEKKKGPRKRRTEKQEDDSILNDLNSDVNNGEAKVHTYTKVTTQPTTITATMRDYQMEALNWLLRLHDSNINGILADEMGLGKTLETISILAYLKEYRNVNGPFLIIVPLSTSENWFREVTRWCPSLSRFIFHGSKEVRAAQRPQVGQLDITITTYEVVNIELSTLKKTDWEYVIIDEAHRIKNENSLLSANVRQLNSKHRLLLTGTPLQNSLHELWALLNFLLPSIFDNAEEFTTAFDMSTESKGLILYP